MDAPSFRKGAIGDFDPNCMAANYKLIETYFKLKIHSILLRLIMMTSWICREVPKLD